MEVAERLHQVRHGRVAGAMLVLRLGNAAIDQHLHVARQAPDEIAHRQRRRGKARLVDVTDHQRPGVMNGLRGRPRSNSSCTSELNGCPDGSCPSRSQIASPECLIACTRLKTLEILCTENGVCASPAQNSSPSLPYTAIPSCCAGTPARAGM